MVTPLSPIRRDADAVVAGTPYEYDYIRTTGERQHEQKDLKKWVTINVDTTETEIFDHLWVKIKNGRDEETRPVDVTDELMNVHALVVPKSLRNGNVGLLYDVPHYFRGHAGEAVFLKKKNNCVFQSVHQESFLRMRPSKSVTQAGKAFNVTTGRSCVPKHLRRH